MGLRDSSGSQKIVIFSNAIIRLAQFIVAAATLGVYGQQKGYWVDHGIPSRVVSRAKSTHNVDLPVLI